jgi:hypothetical protein
VISDSLNANTPDTSRHANKSLPAMIARHRCRYGHFGQRITNVVSIARIANVRESINPHSPSVAALKPIFLPMYFHLPNAGIQSPLS